VSDDARRQRFSEVVMPHLDDALSLARWLTGNVADAEDVVQDACIRAYRAVDTVRERSPRAWLLTIVRNSAFTWLARNRPKTLLVTDDERIFEEAGRQAEDAASASTPEAAMIAKADGELLQREIGALPVSYREVLVLREIEELSYREISELMAIPVGTVMSRLSRARNLLIERIGKANSEGKKVA
jgi:RNA polymerase sigma-70 factor, ECF subfamily